MRTIRIVFASISMGMVAGCASTAQPAWINPFPAAQAPGAADDTQQEIANKKIVLDYYQAANNAKDFNAASQFVATNVKLHDPASADGLPGLQARIQSLVTERPQSRVEVKRVLTSGDQVFLHSHAIPTPGSVGFIAGDIFRLENGRIVEQWSVLHAIPEKPHPDNPNGPF